MHNLSDASHKKTPHIAQRHKHVRSSAPMLSSFPHNFLQFNADFKCVCLEERKEKKCERLKDCKNYALLITFFLLHIINHFKKFNLTPFENLTSGKVLKVTSQTKRKTNSYLQLKDR